MNNLKYKALGVSFHEGAFGKKLPALIIARPELNFKEQFQDCPWFSNCFLFPPNLYSMPNNTDRPAPGT